MNTVMKNECPTAAGSCSAWMFVQLDFDCWKCYRFLCRKLYTRKHHSFVCSFVCMWDIEFEGEGKPDLDLENDEGGTGHV